MKHIFRDVDCGGDISAVTLRLLEDIFIRGRGWVPQFAVLELEFYPGDGAEFFCVGFAGSVSGNVC